MPEDRRLEPVKKGAAGEQLGKAHHLKLNEKSAHEEKDGEPSHLNFVTSPVKELCCSGNR